MPSNYKRKLGNRRYADYEAVTLSEALKELRNGKSVRSVSTKYSIPVSTLYIKKKGGTVKKPGGQKRLDDESELALVSTIETLTGWLVPLRGLEIRRIVQECLNRQGLAGTFPNDNMPGPDWLKGFMFRHNLTTRVATNVKRARATVTADTINEYFDNLEKELEGIPPSNILNYDETNLTDNPGVSKVIVRRGTKRVDSLVEGDPKYATSIMFCGTAEGTFLPPMIVYKADNCYEGWMRGGPVGAIYSSTPSGWFKKEQFRMWFFQILLPYVKTLTGTAAVIGDNLDSYFSCDVISATLENNIKFITIPSNSTHYCQPLDVAVFGPVKRQWRNTLSVFRRKSGNRQTLPKERLPPLVADLFQKLNGNNLVAGFKCTGMYPLDRNVVLSRLAGASIATSHVLDESVIEILKEHCGVGKEPYRKHQRGKKNPPGTRITNSDADNNTGNCDACNKRPYDKENGDDVWIGCDTCPRWYHLQCTDIQYNSSEYYDIDVQKTDFSCVRC